MKYSQKYVWITETITIRAIFMFIVETVFKQIFHLKSKISLFQLF